MSSFDDLTNSVTCRFNHVIKAACSSLFELLDLNNFWYYKLTNDGHYSYFGTHIEISEYFSAQKLYIKFPYYRHPKHFTSGISLQETVPDPSTAIASMGKLGIHHSLLIMKKNQDGVESFGFSSGNSDGKQLSKMLAEVPLLRLFTDKFREENPLIFSKLKDNQIDLASLIGPEFFSPIIKMDSQFIRDKRSFLTQLGVSPNESLTLNDIKAIRLLLEGYSANEMGNRTFRSKRTVEHHLERIKDKLLCRSKAELIRKVRELERLGYLEA